jgi:hypothetical protein
MASEQNVEEIKKKVAIAFKQELMERINQSSIGEIIANTIYDSATQTATVKYENQESTYDIDETVNYIVRKTIKKSE